MEAGRALSAQEERLKKLKEYLAAKGKLKPQNNQKPYLRDTTNLQNKKLQPPPKQVYGKKNAIPVKGKFDSNKQKTSNNAPIQNRSEAGKPGAPQRVSSNRAASQALARKPALPKQIVPQARSGHSIQSRPVDLEGKKAIRRTAGNEVGRGKHTDIGLTVILSKIQHGDKARISDVHVVDRSLNSDEGHPENKQRKSMQYKGSVKDPRQSSVTNKPSQGLKSQPAPLTRKSLPAAGKALPTTSTGHIRIVSRMSHPASKNRTANERSFLIKSSRGNIEQQKQPQTLKSEAPKSNSSNKLNAATHSAPVSVMAQKSSGPGLSAPATGKYGSSYNSKKAPEVQSRRSVSKPAVWQTKTGPVAVRPSVPSSNTAKGTNCKQTLDNATHQDTGKATSSCMTDGDLSSRPYTPKMTVEDRRKKLQEWLSSKGKTYKRPPMILPPKPPTTAKKKTSLKPSVWEEIEEEEELLLLSRKITQTLDDCLELIDKGALAEDIHTALEKIPEGKKFAKYWICKAKLQQREGSIDVVELYKQGVQCGAEPIDELRDVVFTIMKKTNRKSNKAVTFGPLPLEDSEDEDQKDTRCHGTPGRKAEENLEAPDVTQEMCEQGSAVRFQVACLSSKKKKRDGSGQEWKCLTPVRRSVRIHQSASQYPEEVQEHDTVVTCLDELLDMADTEAYLYVRNEALPAEADQTILGMVKQDSAEEQNERPV